MADSTALPLSATGRRIQHPLEEILTYSTVEMSSPAFPPTRTLCGQSRTQPSPRHLRKKSTLLISFMEQAAWIHGCNEFLKCINKTLVFKSSAAQHPWNLPALAKDLTWRASVGIMWRNLKGSFSSDDMETRWEPPYRHLDMLSYFFPFKLCCEIGCIYF